MTQKELEELLDIKYEIVCLYKKIDRLTATMRNRNSLFHRWSAYDKVEALLDKIEIT